MNKKTLASDRRRRKMMTALWFLGISLVVIILIYKELTAVLYILATVGVAAILLVVAFSDLAHSGAPDQLVQASDTGGEVRKR